MGEAMKVERQGCSRIALPLDFVFAKINKWCLWVRQPAGSGADLLFDVLEELAQQHFDRLRAHDVIGHFVWAAQCGIEGIGQVGLAASVGQVDGSIAINVVARHAQLEMAWLLLLGDLHLALVEPFKARDVEFHHEGKGLRVDPFGLFAARNGGGLGIGVKKGCVHLALAGCKLVATVEIHEHLSSFKI